MRELSTDVLVVGGGLGGVAAALAATRSGRRVVLTEASDWLGGQSTVQAVPPDEHPWIETMGASDSYRRFRDGIREYYRRNYPLVPDALADAHLNPGQGLVSPLCHEPRVAVAVIDELLAPLRAAGTLIVLMEHAPFAVETAGDRIGAVTLHDRDGAPVVVHASYVLDATDLGDLLELGSVEHVIGSESQAQTGEPHALPGEAEPLDQQALTWTFALSYHPDEDHTIARPADYERWRAYQAPFWPAPQLSWTTSHPVSLEPETRPLFAGSTDARRATDLWHYRRILYRRHFHPGAIPSDLIVFNSPQIDYWAGPVVGVAPEVAARNLADAKGLSQAMLYWMQTEAPRHDSGVGYPGLKPRGDVTGTDDGFAKIPYFREGRRIVAERIVTENDVGVVARGSIRGAEPFPDSVGIGSYRIDLHPSSGGRNYVDVSTWPFQIPLGALLPVRVENLLPAGKNLGTTHLTNGCYRLHCVEWATGEAAGALAAFALDHDVSPRQVRRDPTHLESFQRRLVDRYGIDLAWPEDIRITPRLTLFGHTAEEQTP